MPKCRVLIVDDEQSFREAVRVALEMAGFAVHEAADGPEGLDMAGQLVPDVILLDVRLPGADGFEVCRKLKDNPATKAVPVIFVTAVNDPDLQSRVTAAGGTTSLTKPFRLDALVALTRTVIENAGR